MESLLINLVIFVIVIAVIAYLIRTFVPAGIMQNIAWAGLVVIAAVWVIRLLKSGDASLAVLQLYAPIMIS